MALTYRTPMEDIVISFEPQTQAVIAEKAAKIYKQLEEDNCHLFNYFMPPLAKKKLSQAGIYLSPFSAVVHSHPVCKTLENYILYTVLPNYIDNRYFFVGIKNRKLQLLKSRKKNLDNVSCINRLVTSADKLRYSNDLISYQSVSHADLKRHGAGLDEPALRGIVGPLSRHKAKYLFLHDELHYWNSKTLCTFLNVMQPEVLLATVVYPPELLFKQTKSLNSWCYTFDVIGDTLMFFPDSVRSEGYQQPLNGGYLLSCNKIILDNGVTYMVDVLCSKFAHHLVAITRGEAESCKHRAFGPFEATESRQLAKLCPGYPICLPLPCDVINKVYRYLRTLKKPDAQSAMAKLSQIVAEPSGEEIDFIEDFARLVIKNESFCSTIVPERLKIFAGTWLGRLPSVLADKFKVVNEVSLTEFIKGLRPFNHTLELKQIRQFSLWDDVCDWVALESDPESPILREFSSPVYPGCYLGRVSEPYSGMCGLTERVWEPLLHGLSELLPMALIKLCAREKFSPLCRTISISELEGFMTYRVGRCLLFAGRERKGHESARIPLASVLGLGKLSDLVGYLRERWISKLRYTIWEMGPCWFGMYDRYCARYLDQCESTPGRFKSLGPLWEVVCAEVVSKVSRRNLFRGIEGPDLVGSPVAPAALMDLEALTEGGGFERSLSCSCGVVMQLTTLIYPEHPFIAPDQLRGRRAGWYSKGSVDYTYNGGSHKSLGWDELIELWCEVNGLDKKYDCCLYQVYQAGGRIGYHADDEAIFEPGESILTVNLSGSATFGVKCAAGRGECVLAAEEMFTMGKGFQADHKHSVFGCTGGRESLTFRCLKKVAASPLPLILAPACDLNLGNGDSATPDDLAGYTTEVSAVHLTVELIPASAAYLVKPVPGDGNCFWYSVAELQGLDALEFKRLCMMHEFDEAHWATELLGCKPAGAFTTDAGIVAAAARLHARINIWNIDTGYIHVYSVDDYGTSLNIILRGVHFEPMRLKNGCVITSVADGLGRKESEVQAVLEQQAAPGLLDEIWSGLGLTQIGMELVFKCFDIAAHVVEEGKVALYNESGSLHLMFNMESGHLSFNPRKKDPPGQLLTNVPSSKKFPSCVLEPIREGGTKLELKARLVDAGLLADSMHSAQTGVLGSALFNDRPNMRDYFQSELVSQKACLILGTFGSGKSSIFKKLLEHGHGKVFDYVSPRRALADEFKSYFGINKRKKVGQENWCVSTYESFLCRAEFLVEGQVLVLDEIQLYPPGYVDLLLAVIKVPLELFLVGDPVQSDYDNEKDRLLLSVLESNCDHLLNNLNYKYNIRSRRFKNSNFIGRLPCEIEPEGCSIDEPHVLRQYLENLGDLESEYGKVVLVSSFDEKMIVHSYQPKARVLTFGESTGLTFTYGTVLITPVSERSNEKRWLTALSRFSMNVCLVNGSGLNYDHLAVKYRGRALSRFLSRTANVTDLSEHLPGEVIFTRSYLPRVGKDEGVREEKVIGDPWLKTMVSLMQAPDVSEEELIESALPEEWFRTHLPREELESVRAGWVHKILAKEDREVRMGDLVSSQFTDEHSKQDGGRQLTNAAERFETIYPRHRANDTVTFIMAVKKRLSFSNPAKERAKLFKANQYGKALLKKFLKHVPLKSAHNTRFMEKAVWEFEEKKLSKSAATIENHSGRSCRDWPIDMGLVFSKSQLCTKFDNRFRIAKAAQSIVCFQHAVLCRFAPFMRYIEMKVHEVLPSQYYIHSGKGLSELNDWVKRGSFAGICTESDYEAFDASQDEYIMAFELELMKYLGLPHDLVEDYKFIKTSLGSKLGNFAIMRFSGEASTFLFNTLANMLFTFMRYDIKGNEFICFAGDDMCANKELKVTGAYKGFLDKLKLKAKVQMTGTPTFCGWHLTPDGIYKKPQLVLERMCIAMELNNLHNCIDNYAIEVAYAYSLGEKAVNRMSEEEVGAFYNCVRIIIRNKHLLKSEVRGVYEESKALL
nr:replicase polyprotein [Hop mosaic virus]